MRLKRLIVSVLAFWMVIALVPRAADAGTLTLKVEDLGSGYTAVVNDLFGSGTVQLATSLGPNITLISAMGISKPVLPAAGGVYAQMFLDSFTLTTANAANIRITLWDSGFTGGIGTGPMTLSNTISGNVIAPAGSKLTSQSSIGVVPNSNGTYQSFTSSGIGTTFSGTEFASFEATGSYSLYTQVEMMFTGAGNISFHQDTFVPVPEPGTLILLSSGMFGLICTSRRLRFSLRDVA